MGRTLARPSQVVISVLVGALGLAAAGGAWAQAPAPGGQPKAAAGQKPKPGPQAKKKKKKKSDEGDWIEGTDAKGKTGRKGAVKGIRGQFEAAQQLYEQGKYEQALYAFDAIVRKYPDHEPARVQLAKTLYRLDRIKDAFGVFSHIDPQHLDPETSYEYGWSFYMVKQYQGALYGFQRVPKGHALFDLANYYGAICAIKLKKYEDAEDMLEKAVVLPDKLAKSRTLYIKHVQALRLMKERGTLAKERSTELDQLNKELAKEKGMAKGDPNGTAAKSDKPVGYVHQGLKAVDRWAQVTYSAEHQYKDNHGLKESNYDAKVGALELKSGPLLPIPGIRQGKDRFAAVGLGLALAAEDRVEHGKEQRVLVDETNADLTRVAAKDLGVTDTKSGDVAAEPWIEFPLPEGVWISTGGRLAFHYPNFERGQRTGSREGYASVGGKVTLWHYAGEVGYAEILSPRTKPTMTVVHGSASAGVDLPSKLSATLAVKHEINDYVDEAASIDGPDAITRAELTVVQLLPAGISASALGSIEADQNYLFHDIQTFGQVSADGQVMTGKLSLGFTPPILPWFTASVSQLIQKTKWSLGNEAARDPFELNVVDYVEKFVGTVGVNLAF